jgi:hypothetical protein
MNLPDESLGGRSLTDPDMEWLPKTTGAERRNEWQGESLIPPHWGSQM